MLSDSTVACEAQKPEYFCRYLAPTVSGDLLAAVLSIARIDLNSPRTVA
jgi:hypothetical protein